MASDSPVKKQKIEACPITKPLYVQYSDLLYEVLSSFPKELIRMVIDYLLPSCGQGRVISHTHMLPKDEHVVQFLFDREHIYLMTETRQDKLESDRPRGDEFEDVDTKLVVQVYECKLTRDNYEINLLSSFVYRDGDAQVMRVILLPFPTFSLAYIIRTGEGMIELHLFSHSQHYYLIDASEYRIYRFEDSIAVYTEQRKDMKCYKAREIVEFESDEWLYDEEKYETSYVFKDNADFTTSDDHHLLYRCIIPPLLSSSSKSTDPSDDRIESSRIETWQMIPDPVLLQNISLSHVMSHPFLTHFQYVPSSCSRNSSMLLLVFGLDFEIVLVPACLSQSSSSIIQRLKYEPSLTNQWLSDSEHLILSWQKRSSSSLTSFLYVWTWFQDQYVHAYTSSQQINMNNNDKYLNIEGCLSPSFHTRIYTIVEKMPDRFNEIESTQLVFERDADAF